MGQSPENEISTILSEINQAWLANRPDEGGHHLHEEVVMVMPEFAGRLRGREPMVASWRDFLTQATIESFSETEYEVDIVGPTALATYRFEIRYAMAGKHYEGNGRDVWGFAFMDGRWQATWRHLTELTDREI